jgi:hypothetical protein
MFSEEICEDIIIKSIWLMHKILKITILKFDE